jgi:hypothetical protein
MFEGCDYSSRTRPQRKQYVNSTRQGKPRIEWIAETEVVEIPGNDSVGGSG